MAVGAFMAYNFELRLPWMPILVSFALAGLCAAAVGIVFGLPSLRIKGFYLAVATLACQFFVLWALQRIGWFTNNSASGVITAQKVVILGYTFDTPARQVHADARASSRCSRCWPRTCCAARPGASSWRCATWTSPPR